ncbi:hypothetical protein L9F63_005787, partial [Diploptera punctata]
MPLPNILKRASSYILGVQTGTASPPPFTDGEVIFCKNNVCVHPPTLLRQTCDIVHHPGYLTITCSQHGDTRNQRPTLQLSWIPNTTLRRNPWTIEKPTYPPRIEEQKNLPAGDNDHSEKHLVLSYHRQNSADSSSSTCSNVTTHHSRSSYTPCLSSPLEQRPQLLECETTLDDQDSSLGDVPETDSDQSNDTVVSPVISIEESQDDDTATICVGVSGDFVPPWMSSPELLALQHNLTFPESATASPIVRRTHRCRRFSVDLISMRSLRLFFNDSACTCGQLVVASRESQYKILHFHHGGLDRLASVLQEWNFLLHSPQPTATDQIQLPYRHFMVCRPEVSQEELHPEEGLVPPVDQEAWLSLLNEDGQLEDDLTLRKGIFFGGLEPSMRRTVWPFLLHCFTFQSTYEEREQILEIRHQEYQEITRRRLELNPEQQQQFWRNIQCIVEKDVVRTDRGNPYFAGEDNPNIDIMKNILLNYAVYNPGFGYTQGMSDLLAPVLAEIHVESDAFWCFVGLMQKAIFVCTPTDNDMDRNLSYLRELIRVMVPEFYTHLQKHADAMELLFCHRWILLCFKREFRECEALRMWEACWANYLTDYFHLFLCLAIISIYSDDVIAQDLRTDEMLLHFSSLAMFMDGELILRKARGLLHQFRQMPRIPCTLSGLCQLCGPGMWDSTHAPVVECTSQHTEGEVCPYLT